MSGFQVGSFVTHQKLPELGAGEVVGSDRGALRIRFAGGERTFSEEIAQHHLIVSVEGPPPATVHKAGQRKSARKSAAKKEPE